VPSGRKRESKKFRFDDFAGTVRAKEVMRQEEFAGAELGGADFVESARFACARERFEVTQAFEGADRGVH
jgi:hypothetical protein